MSPFSPIPARPAPASTPNGFNISGSESGGQPNPQDDDGEDEIDPPDVPATGKWGRGGITSRGRGTSGKPVAKHRRY